MLCTNTALKKTPHNSAVNSEGGIFVYDKTPNISANNFASL